MKTIIRQAAVKDINNIHALIKRYAEKELLLIKSKAELAVMLPNFMVAEYGGKFAGSVAFEVGEDIKAEIVSWVVDERYFNLGIGSMLITAIIKRIGGLGIKSVYTLTLRPNVFLKHGFRKARIKSLPRKLWKDCIRCPRNIAKPGSVDCPEIALVKNLTKNKRLIAK